VHLRECLLSPLRRYWERVLQQHWEPVFNVLGATSVVIMVGSSLLRSILVCISAITFIISAGSLSGKIKRVRSTCPSAREILTTGNSWDDADACFEWCICPSKKRISSLLTYKFKNPRGCPCSSHRRDLYQDSFALMILAVQQHCYRRISSG